MAPTAITRSETIDVNEQGNNTFGNWRDVDNAEAYITEGWGEGFMLGALLIMSIITVCNMRRRVLLHKMILIELLLAMAHGTFAFMAFPGYGWYLSSTAALLYCSYFIHNVVAWMKIKPFFTSPNASFAPKTCKYVTWFYLVSLAMTAPVVVFEIFNNFRFFNNINRLYGKVRPYEPLFRDPWWVFSSFIFFHVIRKCYSLKTFKLVRKSPRFGILLAAMILAIIFTIMDILATVVVGLRTTDGINPYWKLALVFKCLTDNIMLDDFRSVLQRLGAVKLDGTVSQQINDTDLRTYSKPTIGAVNHAEYADDADDALTRLGPDRERVDSSAYLGEEDGIEGKDHYSRRTRLIAASAVGKLGIPLRKLRSLPEK